MDISADFRTMTDRQLAEMLVASVADLEDEDTTSTLTVNMIIGQVEQDRAVIVAERDAIAVVRPERYRPDRGDPVLWLLFVRSTCRATGIGKAFVIKLRRRFERSMPMTLVCNGARRESFFSSCGFQFKERFTDGSAVMVAELPSKSEQTT